MTKQLDKTEPVSPGNYYMVGAKAKLPSFVFFARCCFRHRAQDDNGPPFKQRNSKRHNGEKDRFNSRLLSTTNLALSTSSGNKIQISPR